jgi:hypothetical protein
VLRFSILRQRRVIDDGVVKAYLSRKCTCAGAGKAGA